MSNISLKIPSKLLPVFQPARGDLRWRGAYGGRGSAKSRTFATMACVFGARERMRVLCGREFQASIAESFFAELVGVLETNDWLAKYYKTGSDWMRGTNGTEFFFRGLRHNPGAVKSLSRVDLFIVEEAEDVPAHSWQTAEPSIREPKSEIWALWNPMRRGSFVDTLRTAPPALSRIVELNWRDNPWFPDVLNDQRIRARELLDGPTYQWVWEGAYLENSKAQVFAGKYRVAEFEIPVWGGRETWDGPYFGLDFGFSQDPSACVEAWIDRDTNTLYVRRATGGPGIENEDLGPFILRTMPAAANHQVRADNARPETISFLRRNGGLPMIVPCTKGKGSVEDGIIGIRSFKEVVIHPDAAAVAKEFDLYSFKVDRITGEINSEPEDRNNHYVDALRYALENVIGGDAVSLWAKQ